MSFTLDAETITVVGYVDAFEPETATVYDLKTTRFVTWQSEKGFIPRDNHVAQVQCYATLLDLDGITANRLVLLYVDDRDIIPKEVPLGNRRQWMIDRATILHNALATHKTPTPEVGPSCKYCDFVQICPRSDEAVKFVEAMR